VNGYACGVAELCGKNVRITGDKSECEEDNKDKGK
jgi:hypothetical protein